jgi:hypothetical protein
MKGLRHDLEELLREICTRYYGGKHIPKVNREFDFLTTDPFAKECIRILALFGNKGRYYNLDVVSDASGKSADPTEEWRALENRVEDPFPYQIDMERLDSDYYPKVHSKMICIMGRIARAIAWQFTLGGHADPASTNDQLRILSGDVTRFARLRDDALGTTDYRSSAQSSTH